MRSSNDGSNRKAIRGNRDSVAQQSEAVHILQVRVAQDAAEEDRLSEKEQMETAAQRLLPDYLGDQDLTAFTVVDGDPIYA